MIFKWTIALALVSAAAIAFYFYQHADDELRRHIEQRFARHYPQLSIKIRSAALIEGEGIEVRGLSISEPGATGPRAELAYFDEMLLSCQTTIYELLEREPLITEVRIRRPAFLATRRRDGTWSTAQLLPLPDICDNAPKVIVENCTFEFFDPLRNPTSTLSVRDIDLEIIPQRSSADPRWPAGSHLVRGFLLGDHFQRIGFEGRIAEGGRRWQFTGTADGLDLSPELHASLPGSIADKLEVLKSLRANSRFHFTISQEPKRNPAFEFDLEGQISRGRVEDSRLPYPLTDVFGNVRCTNLGVRITELQARNGQTSINVRDAWRQGYSDSAPAFVDLQCERLVIDRRLLDVLPEKMRQKWNDYYLSGIVHLDAQLAFDGRGWKPNAQIECIETSFTYDKFPYRLDNGQGQVRLKDNRLDFALKAYSGADQVTFSGTVQNLNQEPGLDCELKAQRVAVDQKLLAALPEIPRGVIASLRPYGRFSVAAKVQRPPGTNQPLQETVRIELDRCSIKYDKFPYPVHNVSGTAELVDNVWHFRNLEGTNDTGEIRANGRLGPGPGGNELELHFAGESIAIEDELRNALPSGVQHLWQNLQPRGTINVGASFRYLVDSKQLQISAGVEPVGETVSIEPAFLPYRIDGLHGEISYENGRVLIGRRPTGHVKGHHQGVNVALRGYCELAPDGSWRLQLDDLAVDRLRAERDLQAAVPHALNAWLRRLDPKDPLNVSGQLEIVGGAPTGQPPHGRWNLNVAMQGTNLVSAIPVTNVNGDVQLSGQFDGPKFIARAELDLDSGTCRDVQLTHITGPIRIDNHAVLFGSWANDEGGEARRRPITASAYGGWLLADGRGQLEASPSFDLQFTAGDLDLARIGREVIAGSQDLSGKLNAGVKLHGTPEGTHALTGNGYLRLRDADLYRLPQMVALLNILSLKPPDHASFTNSDADFRVAGDHVYFDHISLSGDAITLRGQGEANFNTDLAMTFYAVVGRDELNIPLIPDLFRAASQQIMLIHVDGKLARPNIRRDPFPVVNKALDTLQADFQAPAAPPRGFIAPPSLPVAPSQSPQNGNRGGLLTGMFNNQHRMSPAPPLQAAPSKGIVR